MCGNGSNGAGRAGGARRCAGSFPSRTRATTGKAALRKCGRMGRWRVARAGDSENLDGISGAGATCKDSLGHRVQWRPFGKMPVHTATPPLPWWARVDGVAGDGQALLREDTA